MAFESQRKNVTISGYFLAPDTYESDDDDDDDDNDDDCGNDEFDSVDFSEDKAFSPETLVVKSKSEKHCRVRFKEYSSGKVHEVYGRFPLTDPWWSATLRIRGHQLVAICGYRLRKDDFVAEEKVLMLFLKACDVHEDHRAAFEKFLQQSGSSDLTFKNVHDRLQEFAIDNKEIAKQIQQRVEPGGNLQNTLVQNALRFPSLYRIVPQLLPRHFYHIICLDQKILDKLEHALSVKPWVFGFSSILTRQFNVLGCEASFRNFYYCLEVYKRLSNAEKDGLFIYEALKDMCHQEGHTFVEFWSLKRWKMKKNQKNGFFEYTVGNWKEGLFFLKADGIIVLDMHHQSLQQVQSDTRIYLSRFYFAERDIALNLGKLMSNCGRFPKWDVHIDFESEDFERIRTDEDQMNAAELITVKPVVVLSGKGGCGKTEVVGRVFAYAQKASSQERNDCIYSRTKETTETAIESRSIQSQCSITDEELVENADEQVSLCYIANKQHDQDCNNQDFSSRCNYALGNGELNQTSAALEVYGREKESIITSLPTQNYSKCEEKESSVTLGATQGTSSCSGNDSTEFQGNSTSSALENPVYDGTVLLTAPTGKAAILLGRRSHMSGYTLHQVVYSYFAWKRNPEEMCWKFASVRVLIVDECSLVPVTIFQRALSALLTDAQLSKVVLLGDINQLPSIEPGRFLADVYEALEDAGCSITLRTNHRSESQFIVDNAERILQQQLPLFDQSRNFHLISLAEDGDSEDNDRDEAVRRLLKEDILPDHEKSQFVAFRRRDCDGINELCCKHYNNHSMKKSSRKGKQMLDFRPGDKVCCSRNAYVTDYTDRDPSDCTQQVASRDNGKAKEVPKVRLCNGEIFFIVDMHEVQEKGKTICYVLLSDLEREIKVDFKELKNFCKLKHAWARTIHTFQGSETDALVYVVGSAGQYQNWQHVYTAVTRGKQQVHIMTKLSCLQDAIKKDPIQRNTSLKKRLQALIAQQLPQRNQPLLQEESSGSKSAGETSTSLDKGPDVATPVKASPPQNHDVKSISGGKRNPPDPSAVTDGSPSVKRAKENSPADSLA